MEIKNHLTKFGLQYDHPEEFFESQWQKSDPTKKNYAFLVFKTVLVLFALSNYIANLVLYGSDDLPYFIIYMTNQGLTLVTISITAQWIFLVISEYQKALYFKR